MLLLELVQTHPLGQVLITQLRETYTRPHAFREAVHRISLLLAVEATRSLKLEHRLVKTPLEETDGVELAQDTALIPIMRAGSGMLDAFLTFLPASAVWHVSISRNEKTLAPTWHGSKIPASIDPEVEPPERVCFVLDPMLATGGSASLTIRRLKEVGAKKIIFVAIFAAPEGIARLGRDHKDVPIFVGVLDRQLNERGYILPGCGDAGDRQFPIF
jgi:uracil phosphoribosyltransferase